MKKMTLAAIAALALSGCSMLNDTTEPWEQATGDIIFGATMFAVGAEVMGADVFPLNAGIFSGL